MNEPAPIRILMDGQFKDPATCPKSNNGNCPKCGDPLEGHYGYAGGYGLGSHYFCMRDECGSTIYDFIPDTGE